MSNKNNRLVLLPYRLTAENGAKTLLSGVFYETITQTCPDCHADDPDHDCEICGGEVEYEQKVMVSWDTIKEIWTAAADEFVLGERETDQDRSDKWRVCTQHPYRILRDDGMPVLAALGVGHEKPFTPEENYARARRVVAAWNACKSVSTEDLERNYETGAGIDEALEEAGLQDHLKAVQQRAQLLAALMLALPFVEDHEGSEIYKAGAVKKALDTIRAAIAADEGYSRHQAKVMAGMCDPSEAHE